MAATTSTTVSLVAVYALQVLTLAPSEKVQCHSYCCIQLDTVQATRVQVIVFGIHVVTQGIFNHEMIGRTR